MATQDQGKTETEIKALRLAELDRISAIQSARNLDLTEETADALIQRYLAEDRDERDQSARTPTHESTQE